MALTSDHEIRKQVVGQLHVTMTISRSVADATQWASALSFEMSTLELLQHHGT